MAEAPLSAEEIAHRGFPSSFRGFDPAEVRAYLVRVAGDLKAAAARERELQQRLTDAERRAANPVIDQDMLMRALGEETSRVLSSAQEAARQLQARAEDGVAKILREAHEQAERIRAEAEVVLADRTEEADAAAGEIRAAAQAEAAALVEDARRAAEASRAEVVEQARQLVHEAQAARARVLGDLARRRRIAHTQVEQLRAGRERLLDAYRVVRRTLDEVADELERVESEARTAAGVAARRVEAALEAGEAPPDSTEGVQGGERGEDDAAPGVGALAGPARQAGAAAVLIQVPSTPRFELGDMSGAQAPLSSAGSVATPPPSGEQVAQVPTDPAVEAELPSASGPGPAHRTAMSGASPPIVAREERAEERKLSSLRILRRPRSDTVPGAELEVVEVPSEVEGVRVITDPPGPRDRLPAAALVQESPRRPAGREPTVMPGVSWAPAPSAPPPPDAARQAPSPPRPPAADPLVSSPPAVTPASPSVVDAAEAESPAAETHAAPAPPPAAAVDALFARIRADRTGSESPAEQMGTAVAPVVRDHPPMPPAEAAATEVTPPGQSGEAGEVAPPVKPPSAEQPDHQESLLQRRDEAIEAIETALARKLKRALQDEHNDVLDRLRSCKGPPSVTAFMPSPADQAARYAAAAGELLAEAARSGARFVSPADGGGEPTPSEVADVVADLTEALVGPLRRGVERGVESGQEDPSVLVDSIGAAYRECKTQRLERLAGDATIAAFSRGTVTATPGSDLRWVVDDGDAACPDCDDNALAGPTTSGQQFPTGQSHPPAHAGCRCLLVPGRP